MCRIVDEYFTIENVEFSFYDDFNRNLQYSYKKQLIFLHYIIAKKKKNIYIYIYIYIAVNIYFFQV